MFLTMTGKITLPQFRVLYQELKGDESVANNKLCKEEDEHMQLILKTADKTIMQDLRMNNGGHIKQFDVFLVVIEWTSDNNCKWQIPYGKHQGECRCCYQYGYCYFH